jgi:hypothetical protein
MAAGMQTCEMQADRRIQFPSIVSGTPYANWYREGCYSICKAPFAVQNRISEQICRHAINHVTQQGITLLLRILSIRNDHACSSLHSVRLHSLVSWPAMQPTKLCELDGRNDDLGLFGACAPADIRA